MQNSFSCARLVHNLRTMQLHIIHLISHLLLIVCLLVSSALKVAIAGSSSNHTSVSACYAPDREALLSFARAAGFFNYNDSWHADDCCSWDGITCSDAANSAGDSPRRVTGIDVRGIDLTPAAGSSLNVISPSLCNLSALTAFVLYYDRLEIDIANISIPECVGTHLMLLNSFWLGFNDEGAGLMQLNIPASFSRLSTLQDLELAGMRIDSQSIRHIVSLPSLVTLALYNCPLEPSSLSSLFATPHTVLSNLTSLALVECSLSGPLPPFTNMPLLQLLSLAGNSLSSTLEDFILHSNISALEFLSLSFNSLSGSLPTSTSQQLPHLNRLYLQSNNLSGPLPHLALKNLTLLHLGDNHFSGPFPDLINSPFLEIIDLSNNHFIGGLPENWQHLSRLTDLHLSGNSISTVNATKTMTRRLPDWLFRLPLQQLSLAYTGLQERDCGCHGMLSLLNETLEALNVAGNNFNSPNIFNCFADLHNSSTWHKYLSYLNFSGNPLAFSLPTAYFPDVIVLDMSHCQLFGSIPTQLITDSSLTYLNLSFNNLTGLIHPGKAAHRKTHSRISYIVLSLSYNSISADVSSLISQFGLSTCDSCHTFDVSHNKLTGEISARASTWLSGFWRVLLNDNQLVGNIPPELGSTTHDWTYDWTNHSVQYKLATLRLNNNALVGTIPTSILNITSMYFLDLSYNQLEGNLTALFSSMKQRTQLRILLLSHNQIQGSIPPSFGSLTPSLQVIDLSHNKLSGVIPPTLQLPTFTQSSTRTTSSFYEEYYYVYMFNMFIGAYTRHAYRQSSTSSPGRLDEKLQFVVKGVDTHYEYELLKVLVLLDLSNNSLIGAIPSQFGNFTSLVHLNLSRNMLSGTIPAILSTMQALESMDLSFNQLQGEIPSSFSKLTSLEVFNVAFNEGLKGQIPFGGAFENSSSFVGDRHLCGFPVLGVCSESKNNSEITPTSNQQNNDKGEHTFFTWIGDYVAIPGLMLGLVFGFVGTLLMLHAKSTLLRAFTRMWHVLM